MSNSDVERHRLYDLALLEVVAAIPPEVPRDAKISLDHVRELMVLAWLRGEAWSRGK